MLFGYGPSFPTIAYLFPNMYAPKYVNTQANDCFERDIIQKRVCVGIIRLIRVL